MIMLSACKNVKGTDPGPPPMFPPYCDEAFVQTWNNVADCMQYPGYSASTEQEQELYDYFKSRYGGFYCIANYDGTDTRINMDVNAILDQWKGIMDSIQNGEPCPDEGEGFPTISVVVPGE